MTSRCKIFWTDAAVADLSQVADFITEHDSLERALEICDHLEHAAGSLASSPNRGRTVPEFQDHGVVLYSELIVKPWRLIYRVDLSSVYILAVLDSRRDAADLLWQRLTR